MVCKGLGGGDVAYVVNIYDAAELEGPESHAGSHEGTLEVTHPGESR